MVANVLIALKKNDVPESVLLNIQKAYSYVLMQASGEDFAAARVDYVFTEKEIETYLNSGKYDLFLCNEAIEKKNIGAGTLNAWAEKYPRVRTFLLIDKKRKGEGKLATLYLKGYYNALYQTELADNRELFFRVIINGRTKEEAYEYYGLTEKMIEKKQEELPLKKQVENMPEESPFLSEEKDNLEELNPVKPPYPEFAPGTKTESFASDLPPNPKSVFSLLDATPDELPEERKEEKTSADEPEYEHYPQLYLDLNAMNAKSEVRFSLEGIISEIITEDVMIVKCPSGGMLQNKEALKGLKVNIEWTEPY